MELFDYQKKASDFLQQKKRAYLALDMGMGKTLTALHAAHGAGKKHVLLIAEKNEIVNSQNFAKEVQHFEHFEYLNLREDEIPTWFDSEKRLVCGINPDGLKKHSPEDISKNFDVLIIDEATLAKTTTTKRFKMVHKIAKSMEYVYLLSGTPMMNGAAELYAPLLLLDHPLVAPGSAKAREAFEAIFAGGHRRKIRSTGKYWMDYVWWAKGANHVRELRYLLQDHFFIMAKGETDVFKKKTRRIEKVVMTVPWLIEYQNAWKEYLVKAKKRNVNMDNVADLRNLIENGQCYQVNSTWKAKRIVDDIFAGKYGESRIVVFTMFIESYNALGKELESRGISYRIFDDVKEWKEGSERVIIGRIKAHGKGGNLPEANVALFADMDFVPSNNIQAENRIDRPEQKNEMQIVYYMTDGDDVVDAHVYNINKDKSRRIEKFMQPLTDEERRTMPGAISDLIAKYPKEARVLGLHVDKL